MNLRGGNERVNYSRSSFLCVYTPFYISTGRPQIPAKRIVVTFLEFRGDQKTKLQGRECAMAPLLDHHTIYNVTS